MGYSPRAFILHSDVLFKFGKMLKQAGFVFKVLIISTVLSWLIKSAGSSVAIPATATNALILVFVPTLIVAIALGWRNYFYSRSQT
jgi:hypothetical protein